MQRRISFQVGTQVQYRNQTWTLIKVLGPEGVLLRSMFGSETTLAPYTDLQPAPEANPSGEPSAPMPDLMSIGESQWTTGFTPKLRLIRAIEALSEEQRTRPALKALIDRLKLEDPALDIHVATAYRWWSNRDRLEQLLRKTRTDVGKSRLSPGVENIIEFCLTRYMSNRVPEVTVPEAALLHLDRPLEADAKNKRSYVTPSDLVERILRMCRAAELDPKDLPHVNTIFNRIRSYEQQNRLIVVRATQGQKAANSLLPTRGVHTMTRPDDEWQIDHLKCDVHIVHRLTRTPIGRAWLTIIMDVHSRMVIGWYITLDAPSIMSMNLALVRAILPKTDLKALYDLPGNWDCWGLPTQLHADNAREFRSTALERLGATYGFGVTWRPVAQPNYGGHIERLAGTHAQKFKNYRGASFSSVQERGDRDTESAAVYDFDQFERMVAIDIHSYNHSIHSAIHTTPWAHYQKGVFGKNGLGPGDLIVGEDAKRLKIDALPFFEATVQREGIKHAYIYYSLPEVLAPLVRNGKKYIVRFDPRDISQVCLWHDVDQTYYNIPFHNRDLSPMSTWEHAKALDQLKAEGRTAFDHRLIDSMVLQQRKITDEAVTMTKTAALEEEKRHRREKAARRASSAQTASPEQESAANDSPEPTGAPGSSLPGRKPTPPEAAGATRPVAPASAFGALDLATLRPLADQRTKKYGEQE